MIGELNCVIGMLEGQVQYTQEYISECQSQIMQIEEAKARITAKIIYFVKIATRIATKMILCCVICVQIEYH